MRRLLIALSLAAAAAASAAPAGPAQQGPVKYMLSIPSQRWFQLDTGRTNDNDRFLYIISAPQWAGSKVTVILMSFWASDPNRVLVFNEEIDCSAFTRRWIESAQLARDAGDRVPMRGASNTQPERLEPTSIGGQLIKKLCAGDPLPPVADPLATGFAFVR